MENFIPRLILENTGLAPFQGNIGEYFLKWFNDSRIFLHMGDIDPFPFTAEDVKKYLESHKKDTWIIVADNNGRWMPIGYFGLFIRSRHRIGIIRNAIGEKDYLRKGHGARAKLLTLSWAFNECDLVSVIASVSFSNYENIKLLYKVGFRECGKYISARLENGKRFDEIHFQITKEEFYEKYPAFAK